MYGITIDLDMQELKMFYSYSEQEAYEEISRVLKKFGFITNKGRVYLLESDDMSILFAVMEALKKISWFPPSVRHVQVLRVQDWTDLTSFVRAS